MTAYKDLSKEELLELKSGLEARYTEAAESVHGYDGCAEQQRGSHMRGRR